MAKRQCATFANLVFDAQLWRAADALLGSMDAAKYKHVVLGLFFLKYNSDAFETHRAKLEAKRDQGADPEDPDEYQAENIFWVPPEARWSELQENARQMHQWGGERLREDKRWKFGYSPVRNANFAWVQQEESLI